MSRETSNNHHPISSSSKMGGYEANFNPPLDERYRCPICLAALQDPVQTKCGHRLCLACFKTIRGSAWYFRCPVDNTWSNHVFEDNAAKREVLSLKVDCINNSSCKWNGELRELQNHIKTCQYERIECPNKCKTLMRVELDKHLLECPLRMVKCSHCNAELAQTKLALHHVLECPKFPSTCSMCNSSITRDHMNSHTNVITGDCQMVEVPCSFRYIGCMHMDARGNMSRHYQESHTHHLMLLSTRLIDLETKHRIDLEICSERYEKTLAELRQKVDSSEQRNRELFAQLEEIKEKLIVE